MFSPPRGSPRPPPKTQEPIPTILAAELAMEYASLRTANNCPKGVYITPSLDTLLRWHGVFFVHRGPYAGSVLRFSLLFPLTYPRSPPTVHFESDVFHPMIDARNKIWSPRGTLSQWRPETHHIPHLLHSIKASFKASSLDSITEDEAVNKQVWSLYKKSNQTFISMTLQRARNSSSKSILYHSLIEDKDNETIPASPSTPTRTRKISNDSFLSNYQDQTMSMEDNGPIVFKEVDGAMQERLWAGLKRSLGV